MDDITSPNFSLHTNNSVFYTLGKTSFTLNLTTVFAIQDQSMTQTRYINTADIVVSRRNKQFFTECLILTTI